MRILVVNAGSSSLKLSLVDNGTTAAEENLPVSRGQFEPSAVASVLGRVGGDTADAVGHRVVHGGRQFVSAVLLDDAVRKKLDDLVDLAPLHQPKSLAGIDAVSQVLPGIPAVACFDTAFHAGMPAAAATYALPPEWRKRWDLRRYGFHGLSHAYATRRVSELLGHVPGAARGLPPRLGGVARRGPRRPVGRYHDGLHSAGGPGHGHPLRLGGPGTGPLAGRSRRHAARRTGGHPG